jgi:GDPmannose 4,6-dehydratase
MNVTRVIQECRPDEIYNLGAMSHVKVSFDIPEYTANTDGLGTLRILEAIRLLDLKDQVRIYQASTSELYGLVREVPQTENTPFYPRSPYACAKLYAYWITVNYREAYGLHASNGILFNHESPIRGETFVSRKITMGVARIVLGLQEILYMGNLSSKRDWGHAKDYIKAMYLILQQEKPDDYVIATGVTTEVREFIRKTFAYVGIELTFKGEKESETGVVATINEELFIEKVSKEHLVKFKSRIKADPLVVKVDPAYYRPTEVDILLGDPSKAHEKLGWNPQYDLDGLIREMVDSDLVMMKKENYLRKGGYNILNYFE